MRNALKCLFALLILAPAFVSLSGCGCGFSCSGGGGNNNDPALLTLGFSDALPEDLKEVWIRVESITFVRGGEIEVIEEFTIPALDLVNAPDFSVDLLDYRGLKQLLVIEDLELDTGTYEVSIRILSGSLENSFVLDENDMQKVLNVTADTLKLEDNLQVSSGSQTVTVEFSLAQALSQPTDDTYQLSPTGIRMENNETAASLSGQIDSVLFDNVSPCDNKNPPTAGNRIYLYEGSGLANDLLVDVFTTDSSEDPPPESVAPFTVASLLENEETDTWLYSFGFVPAGEYTMAFSCFTEMDDSIEWNELTIPLPADQTYNITLEEGDTLQCNISESLSCSTSL